MLLTFWLKNIEVDAVIHFFCAANVNLWNGGFGYHNLGLHLIILAALSQLFFV